MRPDRHFQIEIAAGSTAALTGQPDLLPGGHAGGNPDVQGSGLSADPPAGIHLRRLQLQGALATVISLFQTDLQRHGPILAAGLLEPASAAVKPTRATEPAEPAEPAEQRFEKVAEIAAAEPAAGGWPSTLPAGRRPELLTGPPIVAELVVGGAFFGVAQHFVGLGDLLETVLGVGLLANVRVIFASQPTISLLDVLFRGIAGHAENLVVVLVFHAGSGRFGRKRPAGALPPVMGFSLRP